MMSHCFDLGFMVHQTATENTMIIAISSFIIGFMGLLFYYLARWLDRKWEEFFEHQIIENKKKAEFQFKIECQQRADRLAAGGPY